ncbi:hypothetical protein [Micromonospora sp. NPDC005367]|uniref:hypothetical protein n=1 Tax=Micromonospora sp. NPDC005367 TaxID=3155590 RepID=UPI0033A4BE69
MPQSILPPCAWIRVAASASPSVDDASMHEVTRQSEVEEQLRQEVRELTDLLRSDADFGDLRDLLTNHGLVASETLLVGFIGGEDDSSSGVFVTTDLECVVFETGSNGQLIRWESTDDLNALTKDFRAVATGVAMRRTDDF